jgi:predicted nucleic acid-binding protein
MSLIVDASVAIKWYVEEPASAEAEKLVIRTDLSAPSLIFAEVGNAFWKRIRRGASSIEQARAARHRLSDDLATIEPIAELHQGTMTLAIELDHPIYDCFYLALAARQNAPIATTDRRLAALAGRAGIATELIG